MGRWPKPRPLCRSSSRRAWPTLRGTGSAGPRPGPRRVVRRLGPRTADARWSPPMGGCGALLRHARFAYPTEGGRSGHRQLSHVQALHQPIETVQDLAGGDALPGIHSVSGWLSVLHCRLAGSLDVSCHAAAYVVAGPGVANGTARIADRIDAFPVVPRQDVGSGVGAERGGPQAAGLVGAGAGGDPAGAA